MAADACLTEKRAEEGHTAVACLLRCLLRGLVFKGLSLRYTFQDKGKLWLWMYNIKSKLSMALIPALRLLRQVDLFDFEASLVYK